MLSIIAELWLFLKVRKKFWLLPVMLVLGIFGVLIVPNNMYQYGCDIYVNMYQQ